MIYFGLFEISDLENVEINTKIKSVSCKQPEIKKGHIHVCVGMTLIFKVNHQGHMHYFGLFKIPDFENVAVNTMIKSVACIQPEIQEGT